MLKTFKFPIILILSICFILVIGAWAYSKTETIPMDTDMLDLGMQDIETLEFEKSEEHT